MTTCRRHFGLAQNVERLHKKWQRIHMYTCVSSTHTHTSRQRERGSDRERDKGSPCVEACLLLRHENYGENKKWKIYLPIARRGIKRWCHSVYLFYLFLIFIHFIICEHCKWYFVYFWFFSVCVTHCFLNLSHFICCVYAMLYKLKLAQLQFLYFF